MEQSDVFVKKENEGADVIKKAVTPFHADKAKWQWESAMEFYCKQRGKSPDSITEEDHEMIWEYAGNHIAFFLTWLIRRDFLSDDLREDSDESDIIAVKNKSMSGAEFLSKNCDMVLCRDDISEKVLPFMDSYYETQYLDYYGEYMKNKVLSTGFSWDDYEEFESILDQAYARMSN